MANPEISVIIPVKNGGMIFEKCLLKIRQSQGASHEIIVVDDGSTDDSVEIAQRHSCRLVSLPDSSGPSHARNTGAKIASGDVLFFIDSDIIIPRDTLRKISGIFRESGTDAMTGVLAEGIPYDNFSSQYKNLWMRYSYLNMPEKVALFYTSVAAIRREIFLKVGGFDTGYSMPSVEDTDFGRKLEAMGFSVHLRRSLEVEHHKHYSLPALIKTDCYRSSSMVKLAMRDGLKNFFKGGNRTSVRTSFIVGVLVYSFALICIPAGFALPSVKSSCLFLSAIFIITAVLLNSHYLYWLKKQKGGWFFLKSLFFILIDIPVVIIGILFGIAGFFRGQEY